MLDLLDASVWLPLSVPDHAHYARARRYWDEEAAEELAFCRLTSLALLRHLSNARILGDSALSGEAAWKALATWRSAGTGYLEEPPGLDQVLEHWSGELDLRAGHWTDAYLAAFSVAAGCRLVSFDRDFRRYPGLLWLHLTP